MRQPGLIVGDVIIGEEIEAHVREMRKRGVTVSIK